MRRSTTASGAVLMSFGAAFLMGTPGALADQELITIGTASVTGIYYPASGAICWMVNQNQDEHGLHCSTQSTAGSVFNLKALADGNLDMGIVQSDWQYHAYHGSSLFEDEGPNEDLRAVFSLHPEPLTIVARADSGIETFEDLTGKRVNIGKSGSGQRGVAEMLFGLYGWSIEDDLELAAELPSSEQARALCSDEIDAILFIIGHPAASVQEATAACDTRLIPVTGEIIDDLVEQNPYYFRATIPGGMYDGTSEDIATFGVGATFVSSTAVSADSVYHMVKAVFENLEAFKNLHPAFGILEAEIMANEGLSAPLHEGAKRYFEEAGLM